MKIAVTIIIDGDVYDVPVRVISNKKPCPCRGWLLW